MLLIVNRAWSSPPWWLICAVVVVLAVSFVLFRSAHSEGQVVARALVLWLLTVLLTGITLAPTGPALPVLLGSLLYGTIAAVLWLGLPLVICSFFQQGRRAR